MGPDGVPSVSVKVGTAMGGVKVLSLELFNKTYWAQDAMLVASTGLQKMKALVNDALTGK